VPNPENPSKRIPGGGALIKTTETGTMSWCTVRNLQTLASAITYPGREKKVLSKQTLVVGLRSPTLAV
jgi:hypothetical protein